jgi:fructose/tagatose bisphosphate aldolase
LRAFTRVVKIRNLPELLDLLNDMEPAIARVMRQLRKSAIHTHLVPVALRADHCVAIASVAVEAADTS